VQNKRKLINKDSCFECEGKGWVFADDNDMMGNYLPSRCIPCEVCNGTGKTKGGIEDGR